MSNPLTVYRSMLLLAVLASLSSIPLPSTKSTQRPNLLLPKRAQALEYLGD